MATDASKSPCVRSRSRRRSCVLREEQVHPDQKRNRQQSRPRRPKPGDAGKEADRDEKWSCGANDSAACRQASVGTGRANSAGSRTRSSISLTRPSVTVPATSAPRRSTGLTAECGAMAWTTNTPASEAAVTNPPLRPTASGHVRTSTNPRIAPTPIATTTPEAGSKMTAATNTASSNTSTHVLSFGWDRNAAAQLERLEQKEGDEDRRGTDRITPQPDRGEHHRAPDESDCAHQAAVEDLFGLVVPACLLIGGHDFGRDVVTGSPSVRRCRPALPAQCPPLPRPYGQVTLGPNCVSVAPPQSCSRLSVFFRDLVQSPRTSLLGTGHKACSRCFRN